MQLNRKLDSAIVPVKDYAILTRNWRKNNHPTSWRSLLKITLGAVGLVLILTLPAIACGGSFPNNQLFASELFVLPAIASFYAYGIPLVAIVLIEAYILHKREEISFLKACGFTTLANIFYLFACAVSFGSFAIIFPVSLIGSAISAAMCVSFCQRTGYLKKISQGMFIFLVYLFFMGLGLASLFLVETLNISADRTLLYAVTAGILLIGFIFSFVVKGFAIARLLRDKRPSLATTVMSMQVGSFPVVAIAYYLMQSYRWY